jgi:hypothetical protein
LYMYLDDFRKAKVLEEKYKTEEAIGILRRVTRLYPNNKPAQVTTFWHLFRELNYSQRGMYNGIF